MRDVATITAVLQARVAAYLDEGDPDPILAEDTVAHVVELISAARSPDGTVPAELIVFAGRIRFYRYEAGDDPEDLESAATLLAAVLAVAPHLVPDEFHSLLDLEPPPGPPEDVTEALRLLGAATAEDGVHSLDQGIGLLRQVLDRTPADNPHTCVYYSNLCGALLIRYWRMHRAEDLRQAVDFGRRAVAAADPGDTGRGLYLSHLASALAERHLREGRAGDLDEAITLSRDAVEVTEPDDPDLPMYLSNLGLVLMKRFRLERWPDDVAESVAATRAGADATPPGSARRAAHLNNHALALWTAAGFNGDVAGLRIAVDVAAAAIAATLAGAPDRPIAFGTSCLVLKDLYVATSAPEAIDASVTAGRQALLLIGPEHRGVGEISANLSMALRERFHGSGDAADLDDAIDLARTAVARSGPDDPSWAALHARLALPLRDRFEFAGDTADMDGAVAAVDALTPAGTGDPQALAGRATVLATRYRYTDDPSDLDEAIRTAEAALAIGFPSVWDRATALHLLSSVQGIRAERFGRPSDLAGAVAAARAAVELTAAGGVDRADHLVRLCEVLRLRHTITGNLADLDEAVEVGRRAVTIESGTTSRGLAPAALSVALWTRYDRLGAMADIDEAVTTGRAAVSATPAAHPTRAGRLVNLTTALIVRSLATDLAGADEAVDVCRQAVMATESRPREHATALANLGLILIGRYDGTRERPDAVADLDEAIAALTAAAPIAELGEGSRMQVLLNLSLAMQIRYDERGDPADLEAAIRTGRAALTCASPEHPDSARAAGALAQVLRRRAYRSGSDEDAQEAMELLGRAAGSDTALVLVRVNAARTWVALAAELGRTDRARDAYAIGMALLPAMSWHGVRRTDRERLLMAWPELARDAAAVTVGDGDGAAALGIMEQGRGVLWSQILDLNTDLASLRATEPTLADDLDDVRRQLSGGPQLLG